jgi:hypothetical protein
MPDSIDLPFPAGKCHNKQVLPPVNWRWILRRFPELGHQYKYNCGLQQPRELGVNAQ